MSFQAPVTVFQVLSSIRERRYLLPAIQREFVWRSDQVLALVDSLMRGYPIGSFLLWDVKAETAQDFVFYDFITDFHEKNAPFATKASVSPGAALTAVLDGQQRLTSLNIAFNGSHTEKRKRVWHTNPDAYPRRRAYLNLSADARDEELGLKYDLRFLTADEAKPTNSQPDAWFALSDVLKLSDSGPAIMRLITERGVGNDAFDRLYALFDAVRVKSPINWYLEADQDPNKVLDIFVRVNSGGTTLSYSDLLLSMATNQWKERDAREEVRQLVQEINHSGSHDFNFSKDVVLKSALMIAGVNLSFRVSNFTANNMSKVEQAWPLTVKSLRVAAALLNQFGYNTQTLTADSVLVPLAYYASQLEDPNRYLESSKTAADRRLVQQWVARSLLKPGIWGSGLDTVLGRIRDAIDASKLGDEFPMNAIETEMSALGKSLRFDQADIDDVLEMKYAAPKTFAALALLYPGLDLSKSFHQDHVFPRSRFTEVRLRAAGVNADDIGLYRDRFNSLANLQLLAGVPNIEKQDKLPAEWLAGAFTDEAQADVYLRENDLDGVDLGLGEFLSFYEKRRTRMGDRLGAVLGPWV